MHYLRSCLWAGSQSHHFPKVDQPPLVESLFKIGICLWCKSHLDDEPMSIRYTQNNPAEHYEASPVQDSFNQHHKDHSLQQHTTSSIRKCVGWAHGDRDVLNDLLLRNSRPMTSSAGCLSGFWDSNDHSSNYMYQPKKPGLLYFFQYFTIIP